jgi:O-antigen ligase
LTFPALLAGLLACAILTMWLPGGWAWPLFQAGLFALAGIWTILALLRHRSIRGSPMLIPLAGVLLWGLAQAALGHTIYRWASWTSLLTWTTWSATFFLSLQVSGDRPVRRWFLRAAAIFGVVLSVVSTLQMYTSGGRIFWLFPSDYTEFVLGPFLYRNQYAAFIELLLPVTLAESLRDKRRWLAWCLAAGGMFASLIAAASRAGVLLGTVEITAVLAIAAARRLISRRMVLQTMGAFTAIAVVLTLVVGMDALRKRFDEGDPLEGRREIYAASLHMIYDRPWTGFGLGAWPTAYPRYALFDDGSFVNQAHNDWAQWTVEGGIPFLALLLLFLLPAVPAALDSVWGIGILAMLAHALVDYPFQQRPALGAWCFALLGALAARGRIGNRALLE